MPITPRPRPAGRYGQATLDPSRPLYVCRRISRGAAGALVPGQMFDASTTAPHRLRSLYGNGYISHDPPAPGVAQVVAAALARAEQGNSQSPAVDAVPPPGFSVPPTPTDADGMARIRAVPDERVTVPVPAPDPKPAKRPRAGA